MHHTLGVPFGVGVGFIVSRVVKRCRVFADVALKTLKPTKPM